MAKKNRFFKGKAFVKLAGRSISFVLFFGKTPISKTEYHATQTILMVIAVDKSIRLIEAPRKSTHPTRVEQSSCPDVPRVIEIAPGKAAIAPPTFKHILDACGANAIVLLLSPESIRMVWSAQGEIERSVAITTTSDAVRIVSVDETFGESSLQLYDRANSVNGSEASEFCSEIIDKLHRESLIQFRSLGPEATESKQKADRALEDEGSRKNLKEGLGGEYNSVLSRIRRWLAVSPYHYLRLVPIVCEVATTLAQYKGGLNAAARAAGYKTPVGLVNAFYSLLGVSPTGVEKVKLVFL
jgi:hypothetical protein